MTTQRRSLRRALATLALVALSTTAACSSGSDDSGGDAMTEERAPAASDGDAAVVGGATDSGGAGVPDEYAGPGSGVGRTVVTLRSVIKTGEVAVTNKDLDAARQRLDGVLTSLRGIIDSESTQHDRKGRIESSTIVLRVPVESFDAAMSALEGLGRVKRSDTGTKDVTAEVIDVDERVQTLENSLDRLQAYQNEAQDIDDLIRYEQQITQREAELQSLKSQQSYLSDQTTLSTITLYLSTPEEYVEPPGRLDDAGFLAGLKSGWNALTGTVLVVLTAVGALLPFLVVLGLVGVPLWLLVRRTVRGRAAPAPTADIPTATAAD